MTKRISDADLMVSLGERFAGLAKAMESEGVRPDVVGSALTLAIADYAVQHNVPPHAVLDGVRMALVRRAFFKRA